MKTAKRLISMLLIAAFLLSLAPAALMETSAKETPADLSEVSPEAREAVLNLWEHGVVKGKDGVHVDPKGTWTRAEMAIIMSVALGFDTLAPMKQTAFTDLEGTNAGVVEHINRAVAMGLMAGTGNGKFNPTGKIQLNEVITILCNALKLEEPAAEAVSRFKNFNSLAEWEKKFVLQAELAGLIDDYPDVLNTNATLTREEAMVLMSRMLGEIIDEDTVFDGLVCERATVRKPGVTIKNLTVDNLLITQGVGDGDVWLDNCKIGALTVRGGGKNSIHIIGTNVENLVIETYSNGSVRVVSSDGSAVEVVYVNDGSDEIILEGEFVNITVNNNNPAETNAEGETVQAPVTVKLVNVTAATVSINAAVAVTTAGATTVETVAVAETAVGSTVTFTGETTVKTVEIKAESVVVSAESTASVATVEVSAANAAVDVPNAEVKVAEGVEGTKVGGEEVKGGESVTTGSDDKPVTDSGTTDTGTDSGTADPGTGGTTTTYNYSITFDGKGNTSGTMAAQTGSTTGSTVTLTANAFIKTGYTFEGWDTDSAATTVVYADQESISSSFSGTLYAVWTATYTLPTAGTAQLISTQAQATAAGLTSGDWDWENQTVTGANWLIFDYTVTTDITVTGFSVSNGSNVVYNLTGQSVLKTASTTGRVGIEPNNANGNGKQTEKYFKPGTYTATLSYTINNETKTLTLGSVTVANATAATFETALEAHIGADVSSGKNAYGIPTSGTTTGSDIMCYVATGTKTFVYCVGGLTNKFTTPDGWTRTGSNPYTYTSNISDATYIVEFQAVALYEITFAVVDGDTIDNITINDSSAQTATVASGSGTKYAIGFVASTTLTINGSSSANYEITYGGTKYSAPFTPSSQVYTVTVSKKVNNVTRLWQDNVGTAENKIGYDGGTAGKTGAIEGTYQFKLGTLTSDNNTTTITLAKNDRGVIPWYTNGGSGAAMIGMDVRVPTGYDQVIARQVYATNNSNNWGDPTSSLGMGWDGGTWNGDSSVIQGETPLELTDNGIAWLYPRLNEGKYWKYVYVWHDSGGTYGDLVETIIIDASAAEFKITTISAGGSYRVLQNCDTTPNTAFDSWKYVTAEGAYAPDSGGALTTDGVAAVMEKTTKDAIVKISDYNTVP